MFEIIQPDDWHIHFRNDVRMPIAVKESYPFNRCLVMPNDPAIINYQLGFHYKRELKQYREFSPQMVLMLQEDMTREFINTNFACFVACKLYPKNATTASNNGISNPEKLYPVFEAMQDKGLVLCIHAEDPSVFILDREKAYIDRYVKNIVKIFPGLRVVIEHLSSKYGVDFILGQHNNVAATITAHHLTLTLDDVINQPHNYCHPICKSYQDRRALINAVFFNNNKFFYGSDSAPHLIKNKENKKVAAGIFMPGTVALSTLIDLFEEDNDLTEYKRKSLEQFISINGAKYYKQPINNKTIKIEKRKWQVPFEYNGIVPFKADEWVNWTIIE